MTIASANIKFSDIATEITAGGTTQGATNVSLKTISGKSVKQQTEDAQGAGPNFSLAKETWAYGGATSGRSSGTVTSAQGTGKAGLNTPPYALSEWGGYDPITNSEVGTDTVPVVKSFNSTISANRCLASSTAGVRIFCTKSGNRITIFAGSFGDDNSTFFGAVTAFNGAGSSSAITNGTNATEIGRLDANTAGHLPTGCTMSTVTGTNAITGQNYFVNDGLTLQTIALGANTTTNLGSTEIGYQVKAGGITEFITSEGTGNLNINLGIKFNWTWPTSPSGDSYNANATVVWVHLHARQQFGSSSGFNRFNSC